MIHRNVHHPGPITNQNLKLSNPSKTGLEMNPEDPLPSPSKTHSSAHHSTQTGSGRFLCRILLIPSVFTFLLIIALNLYSASKKLHVFKVEDSPPFRNANNQYVSYSYRYVEILNRNWLLQQFKSLQNMNYLSVSRNPDENRSVKPQKGKKIRKERQQQQLVMTQPPNITRLLAPDYDPFNPYTFEGITVWDLFPPNMNCPDLTRIGAVGEGGKWVCGLSYLQSLEEACIIYSFGISDDISFEIELLLLTNCVVYAFDPTIGGLPIPISKNNNRNNRSGNSSINSSSDHDNYVEIKNQRISVAEIKQRIIFNKIALNNFTGTNDRFLWNEHLLDIMSRNHHSFIHLLKVDVESTEWKIFRSLLGSDHNHIGNGIGNSPSKSLLPVGEIFIELHYETLNQTVDFFQSLYENQFFSVSREINLIPCLQGRLPFAAEYTFVNVNNFYGVRSFPSPSSSSSDSAVVIPSPSISSSMRREEGKQQLISSNESSFSSSSSSSLSQSESPLILSQPVQAVIYFLTQRIRLPKMCNALTLLFEHFLLQFPSYSVLIFHDDLTNEDELFLRHNCPKQTITKTKAATAPKMKLFFKKIDLKIPKQLVKRKVFIPKKTFCDPSHSSIGYRHMCRFHAHMVHKYIKELEPKLFPKKTRNDYFIWRLDDDSQLTTPIGYDLFKLMKLNRKLYGFVSLIKDDVKCVRGLWELSRGFYQNYSIDSVTTTDHNSHYNYSSSLLKTWQEPYVFYNNFEISHSSVWSHPLWMAYRDFIDSSGGIYTLRWGDAPLHTIGMTAILRRDQIHKFSDIGYTHFPFLQQPAKGLPMPGLDPLLTVPVECHYYTEWNCQLSYSSNMTGNHSFASSLLARSRQQQQLANHNIASHSSSAPKAPFNSLSLVLEEMGVLFTFGEEKRESLLVETMKNIYYTFARRFSVPFIVFYEKNSRFNETVVRRGLVEVNEIIFSFHPVILPKISSSAINNSPPRKNMNCWARSDLNDLSISLFLQKAAFDALQSYGFQWFFRFPDDYRILTPITTNPFSVLQKKGKKIGFIASAKVETECSSSLLSFTDELCDDLDRLSRELPGVVLPETSSNEGSDSGRVVVPLLPQCSSGYSHSWDKQNFMITSATISHSSVWDSTLASLVFDITTATAASRGGSSVYEEFFSQSSSNPSPAFHDLMLLFKKLLGKENNNNNNKNNNNSEWIDKIANWGDLLVHNVIARLSLSTSEIHQFEDIFVEFYYNAVDSSSSSSSESNKTSSDPRSAIKQSRSFPDASNRYQQTNLVKELDDKFAPQKIGWLGADVAVSIPFPEITINNNKNNNNNNNNNFTILPPKKLLWLFGDTLVGLSTPER
jgi:hypothetical protein